MLKTFYHAYYRLRIWFDPAVEGTPYDRKESFEKTKIIYRYQMQKVNKQFVVR